jgi:hypothetical protein
MKLLVDDTRTLTPEATQQGWVILRKGEDLPQWIAQHGWPEAVALDYDLQTGTGSWDGGRTARWLREHWENVEPKPGEQFPQWDIHSRNPANNEEVMQVLAPFASRRVPKLAPIQHHE